MHIDLRSITPCRTIDRVPIVPVEAVFSFDFGGITPPVETIQSKVAQENPDDEDGTVLGCGCAVVVLAIWGIICKVFFS